MKYEILISASVSEVFEVEAASEDEAIAIAKQRAEDCEEWNDADWECFDVERVDDVTEMTPRDRAIRALKRAGIEVTPEMLEHVLAEIRKEANVNAADSAPDGGATGSPHSSDV